MASIKSAFTIILLTVFSVSTYAQQQYTPASIHSHNDYSRPDAFYHAFNAGVGTIEADVFLRNGKLMVAHDSTGISPERSLKNLYLDPLRSELNKHPRPVILMIDVKEAYGPALTELLAELEPLKSLTKANNPQVPLSIVITGNRPPPAEYTNYPACITFDDDLSVPHTQQQWQRVAQVSLNFANYSKWKGERILPLRDEKLIKAIINSVHLSERRIRFWAAPDNPAGWQKLIELHADILSTDKIDDLIMFIKQTR